MRDSRTDSGALAFVKRTPLPGYRRAYVVRDVRGEQVGVVMRENGGRWYAWPSGTATGFVQRIGPTETRLDAARLLVRGVSG